MDPKSNCNYYRGERHLITPIDALLVIERMLKAIPGADLDHVAFALGISRGQLSKEQTFLLAVAKGDPVACANYNTRRQFMRNLFLLDNSTQLTIDHLMRDALQHGNGGNIASTRGRNELSGAIIGVTAQEHQEMLGELAFVDKDQVRTKQLRLLLKGTNSQPQSKASTNESCARKRYTRSTHTEAYLTFCKNTGIDPDDNESSKRYTSYSDSLNNYLLRHPRSIVLDKEST